MITRKGSTFVFCDYKVRYTNSKSKKETDVTRYALPSKQWWEQTADKHDHITIHEFIEFEPTAEQQARLDKVNQYRMPESFTSMATAFVEDGTLPEGYNHPLSNLKVELEQSEQDDYIIDQDFRLSMMEMGLND